MTLELLEIIEKLLGEIRPVGATHIDTERFENLKNYEYLIEQLVFKYARLIENVERHEHSMNIVGQRALKFIKNLNAELSIYIKENEKKIKRSIKMIWVVRKHKYEEIWWILNTKNNIWLHQDFESEEEANTKCKALNEKEND